ncbi:MAG: anti-sigma factor domain-containing protein [Oscillospiraceae bacterium]|nr:anti-sigma factor domain-containing protein [Oscillospiraceae bacterium]
MRGVVMSVKGRYAVLLTRDGDFVKIKNKNYSAGDKISVSQSTGRVLAAAASFLVICGGIGSYFTPAGYVSVDINPSLLMTVNIYDRVINVKALNDDANTLLENVSVKGKSAEDSLDALIKTSREIGYINENNNDVIVEVVSGINNITLKSGVYSGAEVVVQSADKSDLKTANSIGVSIAKANAIEEYTRLNGGSVEENAEKLSDMSVKEILAGLAESDADESAQTDNAAKDASDTETKSNISATAASIRESIAKNNYIVPITENMEETVIETVKSAEKEIEIEEIAAQENTVPITYKDYYENNLFDDTSAVYVPQVFDEIDNNREDDANYDNEPVSSGGKDAVEQSNGTDTDVRIEENKPDIDDESRGVDESLTVNGGEENKNSNSQTASDKDAEPSVDAEADNNIENDNIDNTDITEDNRADNENDIPSGDNAPSEDNSSDSTDSALDGGLISNDESGSDSNVNQDNAAAPQDSVVSPMEDSVAPLSGGTAEGESHNSSEAVNDGGESIDGGSEPSAGNADGFDAPRGDGAPREDDEN